MTTVPVSLPTAVQQSLREKMATFIPTSRDCLTMVFIFIIAGIIIFVLSAYSLSVKPCLSRLKIELVYFCMTIS